MRKKVGVKMLYYRVREEYDNMTVLTDINGRRFTTFHIIGGELLTERERERYGVPVYMCDAVEISKRRIYWCFGARFECDRNK